VTSIAVTSVATARSGRQSPGREIDRAPEAAPGGQEGSRARSKDVPTDQICGLQRLVRIHRLAEAFERPVQPVDTVDRAELRELSHECAVVHGFEGILIAKLRDHQGHEVFLAQFVVGFLDVLARGQTESCEVFLE